VRRAADGQPFLATKPVVVEDIPAGDEVKY